MRASCGNREAAAYLRFTEAVGPVLAQVSADSVRREAADALARFLPHDAFDLRVADNERRELVPVLARGPRAATVMRTGHIGYGHGLSGWVALHQEALLTANALLDPRAIRVLGTPSIPETVMSLPLLAGGRLNHVLIVRRFGSDDVFSEAEFATARCFADLVAIALDNADARAQLQQQATTDPLTGLANRRYFMETLTQAAAAAGEEPDIISVLLIDVDGLKLANDTLGHHVGDHFLITIAQTLLTELGEDDMAARLAGDEFAVLLHADSVKASAIAERLGRAITTAAQGATGLRGVGASIGWAALGVDGREAEELLQAADRSMYETKRRHHRHTRRRPGP